MIKETRTPPVGNPYRYSIPMGGASVFAGSSMPAQRKKPRIIKGETHWRCFGCCQWKSEDSFGVDKWARNGLQGSCRECRSAKGKEWRKENGEVARARQAKYRANDPEKFRRAMAKWRAENPERVRSLRAEWRRHNRDRVRAHQKAYVEKNPRKVKAQNAVAKAIRSGKLTRPDFCEMCSAQSGRIEGHHSSYDRDRWLVVTWLCQKCHGFLHARQREYARRSEGAVE